MDNKNPDKVNEIVEDLKLLDRELLLNIAAIIKGLNHSLLE